MSVILRIARQVFEAAQTLHQIERNTVSIKEIQEETFRLQKSQIISEKPNRLLTAKEACNLINISSKTLWNWNKKGSLSHVDLGGRKYYRESEVLKHKR